MFIFRPPIVYVRLFWSAMLCKGSLFYFEIEGSHLSEGAG